MPNEYSPCNEYISKKTVYIHKGDGDDLFVVSKDQKENSLKWKTLIGKDLKLNKVAVEPKKKVYLKNTSMES